jgi:hypothetical protein
MHLSSNDTHTWLSTALMPSANNHHSVAHPAPTNNRGEWQLQTLKWERTQMRNLYLISIIKYNWEPMGAWDLGRAPGLLQEFPMGRASCHVKSSWIAYYVCPWSSRMLNFMVSPWQILDGNRFLQSHELQKG